MNLDFSRSERSLMNDMLTGRLHFPLADQGTLATVKRILPPMMPI